MKKQKKKIIISLNRKNKEYSNVINTELFTLIQIIVWLGCKNGPECGMSTTNNPEYKSGREKPDVLIQDFDGETSILELSMYVSEGQGPYHIE